VTPVDALGVYGLNSLTAYFGLLSIGRPRAGETIVISAAAGAVGSMVAQIAKLKGCRVIGIAGGREKCAWLLESCGLHGAIDYKSEDVAARLVDLAPHGADIFFDNVGGELLQIVTEHMAIHGRIVVCGQISAYDSDRPAPGPRDMMKIVYRRLSLHGFVLGDFITEVNDARDQLMQWFAAGKIVRNDDVRAGFELLPEAFLDLFRSANRGALLVKVASAD
jgi:NADPH-dependent curcumin reductase CurA